MFDDLLQSIFKHTARYEAVNATVNAGQDVDNISKEAHNSFETFLRETS